VVEQVLQIVEMDSLVDQVVEVEVTLAVQVEQEILLPLVLLKEMQEVYQALDLSMVVEVEVVLLR